MAVALVPAVEPTPVYKLRSVPGRPIRIGFLGSHETSLKFAPWDDPSWNLWGHASSRFMYRKPADLYFDLHRKECWTKTNHKGAKYLRWLASCPTPIYMQDRFPEVPSSIRYPLEKVSFGLVRQYFTSHVAYMIALAVTMEPTVQEIGFFGVNYSPDCEYGTQRGSTEYWMGRAEAMGVRLILPPTCTLLADPKELYGYESHDANGVLVNAYTKRVWTKPTELAVKLGADGLEVPPAGVADAVKREMLDTPPPAGYLGPLPQLVTA